MPAAGLLSCGVSATAATPAPARAAAPALRPNFSESCPSLAHMLVAPLATHVPIASAPLNQVGCADGATGRLLAIVILLAVGIAPLGLAMMAALCWGLRRAGDAADALTAGRP